MADITLPQPIMDWSASDRTQALRDFQQLCEMWFTVNQTADALQHNYIMRWLGSEGLRLLDSWSLTADQLQDPKNIWDRLALLEPSQNFCIHRLEMQRLCQKQGEDFYIRIKTQDLKCKYALEDVTQERILEQFIAGTAIPKVQRELLSKDDTLTLAQALDIAKAHETSIKHMKQIQDLTPTPATSTIDAVSNNRSHKQCGNCGGTHAPRKCPAYGTTCSHCHKKNHWHQVCRLGSSGIANARGGQAAHAKASMKRHGWSPRCPGHHRQAIHTVTDDSGDDLASRLECFEFSSIEKNSGDNHHELYTSLDIQYKCLASLRVKVDTGAQGNILPLCIFHQMFPEKLDPNGYSAEGNTKKRQTILQAYNGTTIKQLGVVTLSCKHKDTEWHSSDFFVTKSEEPAILGLPSSRQLGLVTIHCMVQMATTPATQPIHNAMDLKHLYPDRFKGIGDFEGELHITLREDAQPVVQPPRKYPIQLEEIRTELEKMEDLGVITSITEPTDWVNALAFSRKASGGLRVCLDPRSLNQCIKRTYHKTPTLEEITNCLSGSKVFSKLDAKHGYWSIKLDEESSKLTTFNSPIGRFRFKRLPFGLNISQDAFQQCMDQILSQCPGTIRITNNVIVHGKDNKDHDRNLHHLMKVAQKCGLVFNAAKCFIQTPQIKFFGMVYNANGVHPDPEKCAEIQAIPTPKNVTEIQQFLGIIQFMAPVISKLADQTTPL